MPRCLLTKNSLDKGRVDVFTACHFSKSLKMEKWIFYFLKQLIH